MVRRATRRRVWESKSDLLAGGDLVSALTYERASQDKKEQGKSVTDQRKLNLAEVSRHGWRHGKSFWDNDRSASRHATKDRPEFEKLMERIRTGTDDVLVVWEISRKERDLGVYVQIRDLCYEVGLYFWLVGGQLFDLRDRNDRMFLGFQAVQAEFQSDYIRDNVKRGIDGAAAAGRPHGKLTYGYERIHDSRTKAFLRQQPDETPHTAVGKGGTSETFTKAGIVREIFEKIAQGVPLIRIENDLNDRGIPASQGGVWRRGIVRKIALNPAYIGKRVLRGEVVGDGLWKGLVSEELYWSVRNMLENPERTTWKPARARYLLSYMVKCGVCDGPLQCTNVNRHGWTGQVYSCMLRRCAAVKKEYLDEFVERIVVAYCALPQTAEQLHRRFDDQGVAEARAEAERLRNELEDWRRLAEEGDVTAVSFARAEKGLSKKIAAAEVEAKEAGVPPVLRGMIGPHAEQHWLELGDDVARKREIINEVLELKLLPVGKGTRTFGPHRVWRRWKLADDDAQLPELTEQAAQPVAAALQAAKPRPAAKSKVNRQAVSQDETRST
ncbi:DNA invertase Pin-like site-specific DNA recombinase [Hamadaea flava]|uniref:Recombinase family protein n=1 Tax=Hamadaea flava TaxID=1742688 RepID=A0ABV8LXD2_9ACTN|nr:recombinase family protein [Hamadaea flava]MCP2326972.1 DNA invertase Pin-like site-specific DNA recombinase [Hamadaea flava]